MVEVVVVLLPQLVVAVAGGGYELFLPSFYLFFFSLALHSLLLRVPTTDHLKAHAQALSILYYFSSNKSPTKT
jgi:hypothetical protein